MWSRIRLRLTTTKPADGPWTSTVPTPVKAFQSGKRDRLHSGVCNSIQLPQQHAAILLSNLFTATADVLWWNTEKRYTYIYSTRTFTNLLFPFIVYPHNTLPSLRPPPCWLTPRCFHMTTGICIIWLTSSVFRSISLRGMKAL